MRLVVPAGIGPLAAPAWPRFRDRLAFFDLLREKYLRVNERSVLSGRTAGESSTFDDELDRRSSFVSSRSFGFPAHSLTGARGGYPRVDAGVFDALRFGATANTSEKDFSLAVVVPLSR